MDTVHHDRVCGACAWCCYTGRISVGGFKRSFDWCGKVTPEKKACTVFKKPEEGFFPACETYFCAWRKGLVGDDEWPGNTGLVPTLKNVEGLGEVLFVDEAVAGALLRDDNRLRIERHVREGFPARTSDESGRKTLIVRSGTQIPGYLLRALANRRIALEIIVLTN